MDRLTEKGKSYCECSEFYNLDAFDTCDFIDSIYSKLRDFEDFLEENNFENLQELNKILCEKFLDCKFLAEENIGLKNKKSELEQSLTEHKKERDEMFKELMMWRRKNEGGLV